MDKVKGYGYIRFPQLMFHLFFALPLRNYDVRNCNVYEGNGADVLYGSRPSVYRKVDKIAVEENCSVDEARNRLKTRYYYDRKSQRRGTHSSTIFKGIVSNLGGIPVLPYQEDKLEYMAQVPYSVTCPFDKKFVKEAMRCRYGLGDIVDRPRIPLQVGTGLMEELEMALMEKFQNLGDNPNDIVKKLTS